ncbi:MAG: hypothetical protein JW801_06750 [Bacteroidales bacterium]|nr:hypothetical protein [Bacteroidales bacterium]
MISNPSTARLVVLQTGVLFLLLFSFAGSIYSRAVDAVPEAPTGLTVLERSFDFIYLVWTDNSETEDNFIIERHTEGNEFAEYATVAANSSYYIDYTVEPNTRYYYRVYAVNADGSSEYSNEVDTSTYDLPNRPPDSPTYLSGYFDNVNRVILGWQDNSENETGFMVYRGTSRNSLSLLDSVVRDGTEYSDYRIGSNTTYYYAVLAQNSYGSSATTDTLLVEVGEIVVDEPVLTLEDVTATEVTLSWTQIHDASYTLYRSSREDTSGIVLHDTSVYTDTGLISNTLYTYQLQVEDSDGDTLLSNILSVKTLPWFSQYRAGDSLVAWYIFSQMEGTLVPDRSRYGAAADLSLQDTAGTSFVDSSYLRIENQNKLIATSASKIKAACQQTDELSLECWIKTSSLPEDGIATILSLESENALAFSISCNRDNSKPGRIKYLVNLTTNTTDNRGNPDFESKVTAKEGVLQHLVYTHNRLGEEVFYINGKAANIGFRPPKYDSWEDDYSLIIANNFLGDAAFKGNLYMCAVYNRALSSGEVAQNYYASPFAENNYILNSRDYSMKAFPNPSVDILTIDFLNENEKLEVTHAYRVMLVNPQGYIIRNIEVSDILNIGNARLNVSGLDPGVYSLILINPYGIVDTKNIIINQ